MKTIVIALVIICAYAFLNVGFAQIIENGISIRIPDITNPNDQALFQQRAKEIVREMNTHITSMTMKTARNNRGQMRPTFQDRRDSRTAALELFLDNGDSIRLSNGVKGAPALMEVSSLYTGTKTDPVKKYFDNVINLIAGTPPKYTDITITSSDIESMDVTSIQKVGDRYKCVVSYTQDFIGKRGDIRRYADRTKKQIEVWFVFVVDPYGDKKPVPRLGDISCKETLRY